MRTILLLLLAGLVAGPALAEVAETIIPDDCRTNATAAIVCQKIEPPQPGAPAPTVKTHYLWIGPGACTSASLSQCAGTPGGSGSTAGVFGVLYEESNTAPGLQRFDINTGTKIYRPDRMVLI